LRGNTRAVAKIARRLEPGRRRAFVAAMLVVMTTYLLPMSFGIVGTIAALLRALQRRVNESTLSPRDLALSLFRLPLGSAWSPASASGSFFTPSGNLVQTLSASGLAFLAD
jgi:hypothetical protein